MRSIRRIRLSPNVALTGRRHYPRIPRLSNPHSSAADEVDHDRQEITTPHFPPAILQLLPQSPGLMAQEGGPPEEPTPEGDTAAKRPRTRRVRTSQEKESDPPPRPVLPDSLLTSITWTPEQDSSDAHLPPPYILDDIHAKLTVLFHPHAQSSDPTLALFCPIEAGEWIVDETLQELARRSDLEIITIDAAHLAAGSAGDFGQGRYAPDIHCASRN